MIPRCLLHYVLSAKLHLRGSSPQEFALQFWNDRRLPTHHLCLGSWASAGFNTNASGTTSTSNTQAHSGHHPCVRNLINPGHTNGMIVILGSGNDSKSSGIRILQWSGLKQRLRRYKTLNPVDPGSDTNASGTTNTSNTKHSPLGQ